MWKSCSCLHVLWPVVFGRSRGLLGRSKEARYVCTWAGTTGQEAGAHRKGKSAPSFDLFKSFLIQLRRESEFIGICILKWWTRCVAYSSQQLVYTRYSVETTPTLIGILDCFTDLLCLFHGVL
ncbi:hypothetical protein V8F20_004902 [Naviculisporaceae sp. PSN 640]